MTLLNPGPALNADYRNLSSASFCGGSTAGFLCLDLPYHNEVSFVMPQPKKKKWSRKGYSVTCVRLSTYMYVDPKLGFHTINYQCFDASEILYCILSENDTSWYQTLAASSGHNCMPLWGQSAQDLAERNHKVV